MVISPVAYPEKKKLYIDNPTRHDVLPPTKY